MEFPKGCLEKEEYEFFLESLEKDKILLEYGSGKSTNWFSGLVQHIHSIDHDKKWYEIVKEDLKNNKIENVTTYLIPPNIEDHELSYTPGDLPQHQTEEGKRVFFNYINGFKSLNFDDIFIDGRARKHIALEILPYLKKNSYVYFHDFNNRPSYHGILEYYNIIESVNTLVKLQAK